MLDLIVIGGGVSAAFTLLHLIDALRSKAGARRGPPALICVVERHPALWTGPAYGPRSAASALLITDLAEFCPEDLEAPFRAWLSARAAALGTASWTGAFTPRRLFGAFLAAHVDGAIRSAEEEGLLQLTRVRGEAEDLVRQGSEFLATVAAAAGRRVLRSRIVLLAIGSPPSRPLVPSEDAGGGGLVVDNPYEPGLEPALRALALALKRSSEPGQLLIVGSNASALELLFHAQSRTALRARLAGIVCLSPSGALPRARSGEGVRPLRFLHLEAAPAHGGADGVFAALGEELARLQDQSLWPVDVLEPLSRSLMAALNRLGPAEERRFHHRYGQAFSNLVRRAGPQYVAAARDLEEAGVLTRLQGAFAGLEADPRREGLWRLRYRPAGELESRSYPASFHAAVNCAGGGLAARSPPVLASLLTAGEIALNGTLRGLRVGETLEAAADLFVMGPLLAGVYTPTLKTWHLENARRLYDAAALLKTPLAARLAQGSSAKTRAQRRVLRASSR